MQMQAQILVQRLLAEIALHVGQAAGETLPGRLVNGVDAALAAGIADEALQLLAQAVAPVVFAAFGDIDAYDGEVFGQQTGVREIVKSGNQQAMRQVATGAEDDHCTRAGWLRLSPWRGRYELR